ncbi:MAG: CYTH domain-containing protein [Abitibacteriaceae bacterium]|nr:CYTH domain-containing protein [Abditibacteriaceae bacterium]MBV9865670.1 CYTH domain-containing protein [Abditibacteriaceae bacterium]
MEIEVKYAITGPLESKQITALNLEPYSLRSPETRVQYDTILDTPEIAIRRSGHGLRIRRIEDRAILTLKGAGQAADGVHEREELEEELPQIPADGSYAIDQWPEAIRARVRDLISDDKLSPLFNIKVQRTAWAVERDGQVLGELALDRGIIMANGLTEPINEVEVELKGSGARSDLEFIGQHLLAQLPLKPEGHTKAQRGLALLMRSRARS